MYYDKWATDYAYASRYAIIEVEREKTHRERDAFSLCRVISVNVQGKCFMNQCLYCSEPCTATSIFCDACKASLLRRHHPLDELLPQPRSSTASAPEQAEAVLSSGKAMVGVLETHVLAPIVVSAKLPTISSRPQPLFLFRPLPRRVRIALIAFAIVGTLSLITDGVLLVLNIARHHNTGLTSSAVQMTPAGAALPGGSATGTPGSGSGPARGQGGQGGQGGQRLPSSSSGSGTPSSSTPSPGTTPTGVPLLALSSSGLIFTYTRGLAGPAGQSIQISNGAAAPFSWQAALPSPSPAWLTFAPAQGSVPASSSGQINVNVNAAASQLSPGTYSVQVTIKAMNNTGVPLQNSPQTLSVQLTVLASVPCSLTVSPLHLSFQASLLQPNPSPQTVTINESGHCTRPVSWTGSADMNWVTISPPTGNDGGAGASFQVTVRTTGMLLGTYTAHITVRAVDSAGNAVQGSPQTITVTVSVIG